MNDGWVVVFFFFFMPIGGAMLAFAGLLQLLKHREKMLLVAKGLIDPASVSAGRGSDPLRWAVMMFFAAIGIALGIWPVGLANPQAPLGLTPWMLLGGLPAAIGLGLLVVHVLDGMGKRVR